MFTVSRVVFNQYPLTNTGNRTTIFFFVIPLKYFKLRTLYYNCLQKKKIMII